MISHQLGQIAIAGAMQSLLRTTHRFHNGFSIRTWPILLCKGRLLPLMDIFWRKNLRRRSIHGVNSISERLPCLLETVSLSDVMPKPLSQNFDRAFEHILVQYGDLIIRGGSRFLEKPGILACREYQTNSHMWSFIAVNLFHCPLLDI